MLNHPLTEHDRDEIMKAYQLHISISLFFMYNS